MKRRTSPLVLVSLLSVGCAHAAPAPAVEAARAAEAPEGIDTRPPSVVVELCGDASARPESDPREWVRIVHEYEDLDEAQARARLCAPTTPLVDVAVGLNRLAQIRLQANDGPGALSFLRAAALELAEPFALILLARLEFHGPDAIRQSQPELSLPGLQRDPTLAYAHAGLALILGDAMAAGSNDEQIGMALQWGALRIVDSFNMPRFRAELDEARAETEMEAIRATYQRRFGPAMSPEERSGGGLPIDPARPAHLGDVPASRGRSAAPPAGGRCGGFADESRGVSATTVLGGRARIPLPALGLESRTGSLSGEGDLFDVVAQENGDAGLVTLVVETFRRAPEDLVAATRARVGADYRVEGFETRDQMRGALVIPNVLATSSRIVPLAHAFVGTPDGFVLRWTFLATPNAVASGGCQALARRLALGALVGPRRLVTRTGRVAIDRDLAIDLAGEHGLAQTSPMETWIYPVRPFASGDTSLVVESLWTDDVEARAPANATRHASTLLGDPVEASGWVENGVHHREMMAPLDEDRAIRVVARSTDPQSLAAVAGVGASLERMASPLALPECPPSEANVRATDPLPPEAANDEDLQLLLTTPRFSTDPATFAEPTFAEKGAYQRLLGRPYALAAFRHLAENATPEGRVYALAGLYQMDHADFERRACALGTDRSVLVRVSEQCAVRRVPIHELVASSSSDALRGEPHWKVWRGDGMPDLRGGGIGYRLSVRTDSDETRAAWMLAGGGYTTARALRRGRRPLALAAGSRSEASGIRRVGEGDFCVVTERGSVACIRPRAGAATIEADVVAYPKSFSDGFGPCVLDASGRRACRSSLIDEAIELRERTCSARTRHAEETWRVYDDGPYDELFAEGCGLHRDGSLRCFAPHVVSMPSWVDRTRVVGYGASYRVPIEGRALGVVGAWRSVVAWTDDGSIYLWNDDTPPRLLGRLAGVRRIVEGATQALVASTEDGRVLTYRARRASSGRVEPWGQRGVLVEEWVDLPDFAGGELVAGGPRVCVRFETGRVVCFGPEDYGAAMDDPTGEQSAPREPALLQGAREVLLGGLYACARIDDDLLRCDVTSIEPLPEEEQGPENGVDRTVHRSVELSIRRLLREARPPRLGRPGPANGSRGR